MTKLTSSVSSLPKVGPKYKKLLENLEIFTIGDLLYHFPFRYNDFGNIKNINELREGEIVTLEVTLLTINNIFTKYGKRLTKAKVADVTGELEVIWFNQHFLKKSLTPNKTYYLSGKVGEFNSKMCLIGPEIEEKKETALHTGRLVPIYPETAGISSKWLRTRINDVLGIETDCNEFIPKFLLEKHELNDLSWCLKQIHFPDEEHMAKSARTRFEYEELLMELLNVEKRKYDWQERLQGYCFAPFDKEVSKFVINLPYVLTESQGTALQEILGDMQSKHPMNRLLEGDVGTGKTIVAVVAAYLAHLNGLKTLYMAPTEILANQHLETFRQLLGPYGVKILAKTAATKANPKIADDFDILVGTHAILYSPEKYHNIGLVVIDEQHRFGVEQRGKIVELGHEKTAPHLLTMTATPIPRTLALTLYGDLSLSVLKTHPIKQRQVTTKVIPEKLRQDVYETLKQKNEPTFIVCPLIEESEAESFENVKAAETEYANLKKGVFSRVEIGLLHGRMKSKEKADIIDRFKQGQIKVLVATPVIEVGIDIPEATVIVIESAERYGLASLHQLRGRVGRGQKEGYCFAIMSTNSRNAYTRLKHLETVANGMELAEIDFKIRGQGDVFGTMQHGYKKLKVAKLDNLALLEEIKGEAQLIFPELDRYPLLDQKLTEIKGKYIKNN